MIQITESEKVHEQWYKEAAKQTIETLPVFIDHLLNDYHHDYGTICHAFSAASIATAWAMNAHANGGITGFQAGAVMWGFIRNWNYASNKTGLRIIDYDNMLYPQYSDKFQKTISSDIWSLLQLEARKNIDKAKKDFDDYLLKLDQYNKDIAAFIEKYPDYLINPKHYEKIGFGTMDEHEAEKRKAESGFEFAPHEPYCPINDESPVYKHWESIANGKVPFGFRVIDEI